MPVSDPKCLEICFLGQDIAVTLNLAFSLAFSCHVTSRHNSEYTAYPWHPHILNVLSRRNIKRPWYVQYIFNFIVAVTFNVQFLTCTFAPSNICTFSHLHIFTCQAQQTSFAFIHWIVLPPAIRLPPFVEAERAAEDKKVGRSADWRESRARGTWRDQCSAERQEDKE